MKNAFMFLFLFAVAASCSNSPSNPRIPANTSENAIQAALSSFPAALTCDAFNLDSSKSIGKAVLRVEAENEPLIAISSKSTPALNFQMGRRYAAGTSYVDNQQMECKYSHENSENIMSLRYLCGHPPLPENSMEIRSYPRMSSFSYRNGGSQIRICKNSRSCFDLKNCTP